MNKAQDSQCVVIWRVDFPLRRVRISLIKELATLSFTDTAQNAVLHWVGRARARRSNTPPLPCQDCLAGQTGALLLPGGSGQLLEREKRDGKAGRIALSLLRMDLVILDELGYLPFSQAGGALLFHLLSKLYEHTSVVITTNLSFSEWSACLAMPR
ncbi:ATP-binding protein [Propionivibrio sp.]|uniref:ATP-binding protein n=1 Tax=Propionivibrio sp. TaxID=2212460 RepID=UPI0025EDF60B|nr:ATP-binding protein [Propionivibrio sp.]